MSPSSGQWKHSKDGFNVSKSVLTAFKSGPRQDPWVGYRMPGKTPELEESKTKVLIEILHSSPQAGLNSRTEGLSSQAAQPEFEDGSAYRQLRPTRLDEIKNFHIEVQAGPVDRS